MHLQGQMTNEVQMTNQNDFSVQNAKMIKKMGHNRVILTELLTTTQQLRSIECKITNRSIVFNMIRMTIQQVNKVKYNQGDHPTDQ